MTPKQDRRPGGGRKKGSLNKMTALQRAGALASGLLPLEYLLKTMRSPEPKRFDGESIVMYSARYRLWSEQCLEAAKAAAPYVHPRLATIENTRKDGGPIEHHLTVEFVE
jgi:hypothetical protein